MSKQKNGPIFFTLVALFIKMNSPTLLAPITSHCDDSPREFQNSVELVPQRPKRISFKDEMDSGRNQNHRFKPVPESHHTEVFKNPVNPNKSTVAEYTPKVHIIADYIMKYPKITSVEEREKYKAVFNDQYQEYKDLHRDISSTLSKFRELDAMMVRLLTDGKGQEQQRIRSVLKKYQEKKKEPAFLEKKERCDYLKAKLSHLKNRIRDFDEENIAKGEM